MTVQPKQRMNNMQKGKTRRILSRIATFLKENKKEIAMFFAVAISLWFIIELVQNIDVFSAGFNKGLNK